MSLKEYSAKRNFKRSPEPEGKIEKKGSGPLRFVIQKHAASHLHYDLRLELDGVLLSWAVPKGPSLDTSKRRLAMKTEDHPLEYVDFEGVIPKGSYGAGKMIIWDEGTYRVPGIEGRAENQEALRKALERGSLKLFFEGQKVKGEFALVKTHQEENSWLLIKKEDSYTSRADILLMDRSIRSGVPVEEVEAAPPPKEQTPSITTKPASARETINSMEAKASGFLTGLILGGATKGPMPSDVNPMLASLADAPFDNPGWLYELKWDGFRAIAETHREGKARLYSRSKEDYGKEFAPIVKDLQQVDFDAVFDGEIVVVDDEGRAEFKLLQQYRRTGRGTLVYFVFDLIYLDGYDLQKLPLSRRKEILREALPQLQRVKYSDHVKEEGISFFKLAIENHLEGIIAKNATSQYHPGVRSTEWLKIKIHDRQEAVIGGFTAPRGSRKHLGALLLGVYDRDDLIYIGHTGGGLDEAQLADLEKRFADLKRKDSPFKTRPKTNAPATWVDPMLVCEVQFAGWTEDGRMRQPVFLGLRSDKEPKQVRREQAIPVQQAVKRRVIRRQEQKGTEMIGGKPVTLTNLRKVFWPEEVITKGDLIAYYREISPVILPYLVDRPQSLNRYPNGITGKHFFHKDVDEAPEWVQTVRTGSDSEKEDPTDYLVCQDEATLAYMVNLGCIEINPWLSRIGSIDNPDYTVLDLDPDERPFSDVIQVAQVAHEVLESNEIPNLLKTSGQTGLHIYIPLGAKYTYEQTRQFTHLIAQLVHHQVPEITSLERSPKNRRGKIYLDYLQNRKAQTLVAPYSVRPRQGAPVSTPLEWDELHPSLSPLDFNMKNIRDRLRQKGDLFKDTLSPGIDMSECLENLRQSVSVRSEK